MSPGPAEDGVLNVSFGSKPLFPAMPSCWPSSTPCSASQVHPLTYWFFQPFKIPPVMLSACRSLTRSMVRFYPFIGAVSSPPTVNNKESEPEVPAPTPLSSFPLSCFLAALKNKDSTPELHTSLQPYAAPLGVEDTQYKYLQRGVALPCPRTLDPWKLCQCSRLLRVF